MPFPIMFDAVETAHDAAQARRVDYRQQVAQNLGEARAQAQLISQYRQAAPHLPANAYLALARAGVDPSSPQFAQLAANYQQRPDSNVVRYVTSTDQGTIVQPIPRWDATSG